MSRRLADKKQKIEQVNKYESTVIAMTGGVLLCLWGGVYDFSAAIYGLVFAIGLFALLVKRKEMKLPVGKTSICLLLLLVGELTTTFVARDKGVAVIGLVKLLPVLLFWILWNNIEEPTAEEVKDKIGKIVAGITAVSMILYIFPTAQKWLYQAGRLGGVFQYSNTYALLLLVFLVYHIYKTEKSKIDYLVIIVDLLGIYVCGSRAVMVLAGVVILAGVFRVLKEHKNLKRLAVLLIIAVAAVAIAQLLFKMDLDRVLKVSSYSNSMNERILYWKDAFSAMIRHPLGLGYMGYYFLQPQFQTGNYTTRFAHNDVLQFGLDAGILAAASFAVIFLSGIFAKKNKEVNRVILLLIFFHSLFDFNMQYTSMFCIALMFMPEEKTKKAILNKMILVADSVIIILCGYFFVALGCVYLNKYESALKLYPYNTMARELLMKRTGDAEQADIIIKENGMLSSAYRIRAKKEIESGEYEKACDDISALLDCAGYDIELYETAVYFYSAALEEAAENGDDVNIDKIIQQIQNVPERLEALKKKTSPIAYHIYNEPGFDMGEEIMNYINNLSKIRQE